MNNQDAEGRRSPGAAGGQKSSHAAELGAERGSPGGGDGLSSSSAVDQPKAAATKSASGASPVDHGIGRFYVIWAAPGTPQIQGIHRGPWSRVAARLPGGCYRYARGHRLRRYESFVEAEMAYVAEADRHDSPLPPAFFP